MIVILLNTMNDISTKTLLQLFFLCLIFLSSCRSPYRSYKMAGRSSQDYTKNRSHESASRSHSSVVKVPKGQSKRVSGDVSTRKIEHSFALMSNSEITVRKSLIAYANSLQGTPYIYGGKNKSGFDCSGFVSHVYSNQGLAVEGNSNYQATLGKKIPVRSAKVGDLIFFGKGKRISHVALVAKKSKNQLVVIHCTSSRGVVQQDIQNSEYWQSKILFARDVVSQMPLAD